MSIGVPRESFKDEQRVAIVPSEVVHFRKLGF